MALTEIIYTGNGTFAGPYTVPFPYVTQSTVHVYLDGVETSAFTWSTSGTIVFTSAPVDGVKIKIKRITPVDERLIDFANGATLTAENLDTDSLQLFYNMQELQLTVEENLGAALVVKETADKVAALAEDIEQDNAAAISSITDLANQAAASAATAATFDPASFYPKTATYSKIEADSLLDGKQPLASTLTLLAGLTPEANRMVHFTGTGSATLVTTGASGLDVLSKSTVADILTLLGVGPGFLGAQFITASGNVTKSSGAKKWFEFIQGAGAGGGSMGAAGGGAGGLVINVRDVSSISSVSATIGAGGGTNADGGSTSLGAATAAGGRKPGTMVRVTSSGGLINVPSGLYGEAMGQDSLFGRGARCDSNTANRNGGGYGAGGAGDTGGGNAGSGSPGCILILEFA